MDAELDCGLQQGELTIFGRFRARQGCAAQVAAEIAEVVPSTRAEPGCLGIEGYGDKRDPALFFIHSRWPNESAFEVHASLPHTVRFLDRVQALLDHPLDVRRAQRLA